MVSGREGDRLLTSVYGRNIERSGRGFNCVESMFGGVVVPVAAEWVGAARHHEIQAIELGC